MTRTPFAQFTVGDTTVRFDQHGQTQLLLHPASRPPLARREFLPMDVEIRGLPARWFPVKADALDSLIQIHLRGDSPVTGFAQGRTMRAGKSTASLEFVEQTTHREGNSMTVRTTLRHPTGLVCAHLLSWTGAVSIFTSRVQVVHEGDAPVTVEMLSSFSLGGLTPYSKDDAPGRLMVHRFRSTWSAEGRLDSRSIEDLHLERSWIGASVLSERFGQVGSMPVRGFFPFLAVEDTQAGVVWGARLAHPGSWQMEVTRQHDSISLSGGLADREFGHWWKTLQPGESFETPLATMACLAGSLDDLAQQLTIAQEPPLADLPRIEQDLPIVVNEWCTSWGSPTQENVLALAKRLQGTPATYLVIDDGWAERPGNAIQQNGDWLINRTSFPEGLDAVCAAIRQAGLIPGVWFEFEVCNPGSLAFEMTDHHLRRDGRVLQVGTRRFWDFRDPWTHDYLAEKVIALLKDNGFGYLKVDYNDTIGIGVDDLAPAETDHPPSLASPGEGLRQQLVGVQKFFRMLRKEIPDLVIENCSSGGHRLEPSMMALTSMGSFSDAHETREIPIIAASLQRLILPRQSQVWAVLRREDSLVRLVYSLAATFLGRMCISGDLHDLDADQWALTKSAMELYQIAAPIIRDGHSIFHGEVGKSWRHAEGWQAVIRSRGDLALVVAHTFGGSLPASVPVLLPGNHAWKIQEVWPDAEGLGLSIQGSELQIRLTGAHRAAVAILQRER